MNRTNITLYCIVAGICLSFIPSSAQTVTAENSAAKYFQGVIDSHPAGKGEKVFSMEDVVMGKVAPQRMPTAWTDSEHFIFRIPGEKSVKISDLYGNISEYKAAEKTAAENAIPEDASDITPASDGVIAYTLSNDLYYADTDGNVHIIAESEGKDIIYGQTVSRNEFGISGGIFWSPKGGKIAFYRKDESRVSDFPLLDITTRTGSLKNIKYPMNGMNSERISLGIRSLSDGVTVWADVDDFDDDRYLTNVSWSPDEKHVFIQVVDRSQHRMNLNMYNAEDGSFVRTLLTEENNAWIEPYSPLHFIDGTEHFIYSIDNRDGYKSLYLCDMNGGIRRLTEVEADVQFVAQDGKYVYYLSSEISPAEQHLYRIGIKEHRSGELAKVKFTSPQRMTPERGWHNVSLSEDCRYFIDDYSDFNTPRIVNLRSSDGKTCKHLFKATDPIAEYHSGEVLFGKVRSADDKYDNHYRLLLPPDFNPAQKYPLLLYVYGGPHSQMVHDGWLGYVRYWELLMAQKGYIVYVQDNRGTPSHGTAYEKAINRRCGQAEMEDQMIGINMLKALPFVDNDRIGVHGWSYGGFMTISLMTTHPDVFKVGVAGGPVIDWKWYEIMYGERYMDTAETNPDGFALTSLMNRVDSLKGKLLICQGAIDNTVVWEHSLNFVQKCIEKNIQLDYFPYPRSEHNVMGTWRVHLMNKVTDYFDTWL